MSSSGLLSSIRPLKGRENYNEWTFAVQAYFEHEDMWKYVENEYVAPVIASTATSEQRLISEKEIETETKNARKARSKLILLVDPITYTFVVQCLRRPHGEICMQHSRIAV